MDSARDTDMADALENSLKTQTMHTPTKAVDYSNPLPYSEMTTQAVSPSHTSLNTSVASHANPDAAYVVPTLPEDISDTSTYSSSSLDQLQQVNEASDETDVDQILPALDLATYSRANSPTPILSTSVVLYVYPEEDNPMNPRCGTLYNDDTPHQIGDLCSSATHDEDPATSNHNDTENTSTYVTAGDMIPDSNHNVLIERKAKVSKFTTHIITEAGAIKLNSTLEPAYTVGAGSNFKPIGDSFIPMLETRENLARDDEDEDSDDENTTALPFMNDKYFDHHGYIKHASPALYNGSSPYLNKASK